MNLLLLLSALFSALTGAGVGVRQRDVAQAVSVQATASRPARVAGQLPAQRPAASLPTIAEAAAIDAAAAPILIGAVDLWANRRRE